MQRNNLDNLNNGGDINVYYGTNASAVQQPGYPQNEAISYGAGQTHSAQHQYDQTNIQYTKMDVSSWQNVSVDSTEYSHYWGSPSAFQPTTVSSNMNDGAHCHDMIWTIIFWINFCATIGLLIFLGTKSKDQAPKVVDGITVPQNVDWSIFGKYLGYSLIVAFGVNILHALYAFFCPSFYIKFGLILGFIVSLIAGIWAIIYCSIIFVIFPIISLLITICFYCMIRRYIKFSACVFKMSTKLLIRYPSLILFTLIQMIVLTAVSIIFSIIVLLIQELKYSAWIYLYIVLSYLWITITFTYVGYLTGAGVAASWYFLNGTEFESRFPVCHSFSRAMTTSFGSAAAAGAVLAFIKFVRYLIDACAREAENFCVVCLFCILRCILACIEAAISYMNKYGLIYCSIFGVPYSEGCRRYMELSSKKFVNLILRGCVISTSIAYNLCIFVIGAAILGYFTGYMIFGKQTEGAIYVCSFSCLLSFSIFQIICSPLEVMPETILICFAEDPNRLKTTANELYEVITNLYSESLEEVVNS